MAVFSKRWESDGRDAMKPAARIALSIAATGVAALLLEYAGTKIWSAYYYTRPETFWVVVAIFALGLGPLLDVMRKWSILVPMAIVGGLMFVLELFNHYAPIRWEFVSGVFVPHLEGVREWDWVDGNLFGITNPMLIALVAGLIEPVVVPVSVGLQKIVTYAMRPRTDSAAKLKELFAPSVYPLSAAKEQRRRDFGFLTLRIAGLAFAIYLGYVALGLLVGARDMPLVGSFFLNPAASINTFGKLTVLSMIAAIGAFNVRVRREALLLLVIGHAIAVAASLWLYLGYAANPLFPGDHGFILTSAIVDGALLALLLVLMFRYPRHGFTGDGVNDIDLQSPASVFMKWSLIGCGIVFAGVVAVSVVQRIIATPGSDMYALFGGPDPLIINTVTKFGTYAALCFLMAARPSLRRFFTPALVVPLGISVVVAFVYTVTGPATFITSLGETVSIGWYAPLDVMMASAALVGLLGARRMQYHVDYHVTSLRPGSAECVMALHDALRERTQSPESTRRIVLARIDDYVGGIRGRRRGLLGFPFFLLEHLATSLYLLPSFSTLSREEARWLLRRSMLRPFYERSRAWIPPVAEVLFIISDTLNSLVSLSYFSSHHGYAAAGYIPPDARRRLQSPIASIRPPSGAEPQHYPVDGVDAAGHLTPASAQDQVRLRAPRLGVAGVGNDASYPDEVDYCVIGSGAGGGVVAYRLAARYGNTHSVCVIEQGGYFAAGSDFNDDEMRMIRTLYTDGGLQATRSFDFTILQGECVGGTTVINNAVCFQLPQTAIDEWQRFGINVSALAPHYARVAGEINIATLTDVSVNERIERLFTTAVNGYNAAAAGPALSPASRVQANVGDCIGCGLCNIGCRRMRKLSALETYIPWAQAHGARVLANTGAVLCEMSGTGARRRATGVIIRRADGSVARIRVRKAVIVSGGAIASSRFLLRSGIGGEHVGRGVSCNFALPTLAQFGERIDAFDGLQITMFAAPPSYEAIFETTFNPPGAHSIVMPQYFERHRELMDRYRSSLNFGALVGSDPGGSVSRSRSMLLGRAVEWQTTERDMKAIKTALISLVRFARHAGAERVLLPTHPVLSIDLTADIEGVLRRFDDAVHDPSFINFVTAHPQGGNMMAGADVAERVVDTDFRVRDAENVYVVDASVFPRGARVNPQWTIMSLASMAGDTI